jgi:hypothetical protein
MSGRNGPGVRQASTAGKASQVAKLVCTAPCLTGGTTVGTQHRANRDAENIRSGPESDRAGVLPPDDVVQNDG